MPYMPTAALLSSPVNGSVRDWFNIMDYGAVGDGVTNDRVAIQSCVTAANAWAASHGTATVYVPDRVFLANTASDYFAVLYPGAGVTIFGGGTLKSSAAANTGAIMIQIAAANITVDGISFDMADKTDGLTIRLNSSSRYTTIKDCTFDNFGTSAIYISGDASDTIVQDNIIRGGKYQMLWHDDSTSARTKIIGNTFEGLTESSEAIEINTPGAAGATDIEIVGNTFHAFKGTTVDGFVGVIGMANCAGVLIEGNMFSDNNIRGCHIEDRTKDVQIIGNRFINTTLSAVYCVSIAAGGMRNFRIANNEFRECGKTANEHAVMFEAGGAHPARENVSITDNQFYNCGLAGATTYAIFVYYCDTVDISGNTIVGQIGNGTANRGTAIVYDGSAFPAATGPCQVEGNLINTCYGGISLAGPFASLLVTNNMVLNNNGTAVSSTATGTILWSTNPSYYTSEAGATSVADGGTVAHGLTVTPTTVVATPSVSGEFVSVTAIGATTFTVAIKTHAGAAGTTQTIYWRANL